MAKISKYAADSTVAAGDKLIGTDATTGFTKSYTLSDIGVFLDATYDTDTTYTAGDGLTLTGTDFDLDAALTTVTSILSTSLVTGRDTDNQIKYSTDNEIIFRVSGGDGVTMKASGEIEATSLDISGDADIDGTLTVSSSRPDILLTNTGSDPDYKIENYAGQFSIVDTTATANVFQILTDTGQRMAKLHDNWLSINTSSNPTVPLDVTGDINSTGSIKVTQNLRRTVTTATDSSNTHTCTLVDNDNFNIACANAETTIALVVASENVGQSGMITITNHSSGTTFTALPSYMLTPEGATINFVTTADAVSILSYYVLATDKVLVNYVGNFA